MAAPVNVESTPKAEAEDLPDQFFAKRGCCFWLSCFRPNSSSSNEGSVLNGEWWERIKTAAVEADTEDKWWMRGWKKVREWSEIVAGPRWKTFIRRFNMNHRSRPQKFQYDPLSYALNFDEGHNQEIENGYNDFSARFASPVGRSIDFGKDAPDFTSNQ